MTRLVLVALKFAPVHKLLMLAYRDVFLRCEPDARVTWIVADEYGEGLPGGDRVLSIGSGRLLTIVARRLPYQVYRLQTLTRAEVVGEAEDLHVLVQTPHPANWILIRRLRQLYPRASIRYYLHEPTSWLEKLRKGEGLAFASVVYASQWLDLRAADMFYVANRKALESACSAYPIARLRDRGHVVPLLFRDICGDLGAAAPFDQRQQVLMLGRADRGRCVDVFMEAAAASHAGGLPWEFVILSASSPHVPNWARLLPNLRLRIGAPYSDAEMAAELVRSRHVFNLYRVRYLQSGVTPVALMFGVPVIAHAQEREPELVAAGCLYFDQEPTGEELVRHLCAAPPADRQALRAYYLRQFDVSTGRIPFASGGPEVDRSPAVP